MKKTILGFMLFLIAALPACSWFSPTCFIQDQAVNMASSVVVDQLQCSHPEAVQADLKDVVSPLGICKSVNTGPIADTLCPLLVSEVVRATAANVIPTRWGCTVVNAKEKLTVALTDACKKIPVSVGK